jgi:hypothetical protein
LHWLITWRRRSKRREAKVPDEIDLNTEEEATLEQVWEQLRHTGKLGALPPARSISRRPVLPPAPGKGDQPDDADAKADLIADALYHLHGASMVQALSVRAFDPDLYPRGPNGCFISSGSEEAVAAARKAVRKVLRGELGTPKQLLGHLALLAVKQLRDLHHEHGIERMPRGARPDQLVQAVKNKLGVINHDEEQQPGAVNQSGSGSGAESSGRVPPGD